MTCLLRTGLTNPGVPEPGCRGSLLTLHPGLELATETTREENHQNDEQRAKQDHPVFFEKLQRLGYPDNAQGPQQRGRARVPIPPTSR